MSVAKKSMPYGEYMRVSSAEIALITDGPPVRLGNSGLKVSKIVLGCMSYGSKGWREWVIDDQEEVNKHIKYA